MGENEGGSRRRYQCTCEAVNDDGRIVGKRVLPWLVKI